MPDVTWSENEKIKLNSRLAIQQYCSQINQHFAVLLASHSVLFWRPTLIGCDVFFLFPRLYNLNDCAHHYCSYIPWSSIDVASVDFWRIFPQKHVSKLGFGLAHYHSKKRPLSNAQQLHGTISIGLFRNFGGKGGTFPCFDPRCIRDPPVDFLVDSRSENLTVFN